MGQRAAGLKEKCAPDVARNIMVNAKTPPCAATARRNMKHPRNHAYTIA